MTDTTRARLTLPMSPGTGAVLVVGAVVLGVLGAATLLMHGSLTASTLVTVSGALFGMGLVFAIFRKAGLGGFRITWGSFLLMLLVLGVFAAGPFLLSQYAPGNDPAAVAMGVFITALTLGAGVAVAKREAAAHARAMDDLSAFDALGADSASPAGGAPMAGPVDPAAAEPADYDAAAALADAHAARVALAGSVPTPPWYYVLLAVALAMVMLALGLDLSGVWMLVIDVPAIALMVAVIVAYRRTAGMWFTQPPRGTRAFRMLVAMFAAVLGGMGAALLARSLGAPWLAVTTAVVVLIAYVALGRAYDQAFRADLRAGLVPARGATVRGAAQ